MSLHLGTSVVHTIWYFVPRFHHPFGGHGVYYRFTDVLATELRKSSVVVVVSVQRGLNSWLRISLLVLLPHRGIEDVGPAADFLLFRIHGNALLFLVSYARRDRILQLVDIRASDLQEHQV